MFDLVIQGGKQNGKRLTLPENKPIVVGRDEGCQLVLNSSLVSRKHCELKHTAEGIWATDLGSQNGTYVNEIPITEPTLLTAGDTVRIGPLVLEAHGAHVTQPASPEPPPPKAITKPKKSSGLSDDEIAAWLGEGTPDPQTAKQDTAVYETVPPELRAAAAAAAKPAEPKAAPAPPAKKFRSVKEEAADIIRRHWAQVRGEPQAD